MAPRPHDHRSVFITYDGRTQTVAAWIREYPHLHSSAVIGRLRKGWTGAQCLGLEPPPPRPVYSGSVTYNGETLTLAQWQRRTHRSPLTIRFRMQHGWTAGQALGYEPPPEPEPEMD